MEEHSLSHRKKSLLSAILLGLVPLVALQSSPGSQGDSSPSPLDVIKARNDSVRQILEAYPDTVTDEVREKLKELINDIIDFRELSRRALGKYWQERTEKEKDEFVSVFRDLVRNSSVRKLEVYRADRIEYDPPTYKNDRAVVVTRAYKGRNEVEIVYKLHKVGGRWMVYDIEVDGVSTARTYRDSFYKQIAKGSYEKMFAKLKKRLAEERG